MNALGYLAFFATSANTLSDGTREIMSRTGAGNGKNHAALDYWDNKVDVGKGS
jgi:hypothetical protein